ncbi:alpha/beta fold hydrolase [Undibacterium sp. SXout11W]|uniref:alpha/beta fold hydrolase n=1 Tax=Undibacterium sp. SXout11W TaxID=3413050 RepID=UPI003BF00ADA
MEIYFMFTLIKQAFRRFLTKIFDDAIRIEYQKAGLIKKNIALEGGDISYLCSITVSLVNQSGGVLLMLHGFGAEKDIWSGFARHLATSLPILIPDLPGHGENDQDFEIDYSVHSQANRVHKLLQALNVSKVHIVGHSMGGAIALRLAHLYPEIVSSLVLISAAGAEIKPGVLENIIDSRDLNPLVDVKNKEDFQRLIEFCMSKPPYVPRPFFNLLADKKIARFDIDKKIFADIAADIDQSGHLDSIKVPALIIWGDQDQILNVADADYLNRHLTGSHKIILPGIGHVPIMEDPRQTALHAKYFLEHLAL